MAYKHILIAVDLSPESKVLVEKAVSMARPYNAKISLIHVDVNYSDLYTGLIDVNLGDMQKRISEETHHALTELSTNAGYPITETLSGSGDLGQVLVDAIKKYDMDLVVCGHHQDFWSKLMSSARQLINTVHVDMLIVPRLMMPISLSFDHRVIDGADGARFITIINNMLSDIRRLVM